MPDASPTTLYDRLRVLSMNLWWTWHPEIISVFTDLNPQLWRQVKHNPTAFLDQTSPEEIEERASELVLNSRIHYAYRRLQDYLKERHTWGGIHCGALHSRPVAYFSAEFGLHESLPIYSGGLGVLSGDHLKSASDLGVPLVGVGLLYNQGYFDQLIDADGWQHESYANIEKSILPLTPVENADGSPLSIRIETKTGVLAARAWRVLVGRVALLLLDSDVEENSEEDRGLTLRLYGGDTRTRIRQELLLGIGGIRALRAQGIHPSVLHLNEGHSAFAILEEARRWMEEDGVPFHRAMKRVSLYTVFTTHTPVPAGHDYFPPDLVEEHLGVFRETLGGSHDDFMALGRVRPEDKASPFCMTVLALKNSRRANGVSAIHADISRRMWVDLWPGRREVEVPIGHVTNGVHVLSWLAPQMEHLYQSRLGGDWACRLGHADVWKKIEGIDSGELWETHQNLKMRLIRFVRRSLEMHARRREEPEEQIERYKDILDPDVLTIGFARRFAPYKRSLMIFHDLDRLAALVKHPERPIQLVFAGKAHPRDEEGKRLLQQIALKSCSPDWDARIVFVEDYDINVARHLVQGVDVWLNTPQRPLEACGTSGQKVVLNGGLNLSVLDGWWNEAYDGYNGFAIGHGGMHQDSDEQFRRDADSLYRLLEEEVVPLYYDRNGTCDAGVGHGVPHRWIERVKWAIQSLGWRYNADRMVKDYANHYYMTAARATSCEAK